MIMDTTPHRPRLHQIWLLPLLLLLLLSCIPIALCDRNLTSTGCVAAEREALLRFKAGLKDPSGRLSSWSGEDCCGWRGVRCRRRTGRVVGLDLRNSEALFNGYRVLVSNTSLGGEINQSLLRLKHLNYLDLSMNDFGGIAIPTFIGSMNRLRYVNLSESFFGLEVPHQMGNLSRLEYLDLSQGLYRGHLFIKNDQWLSLLTSIKHLSLDGLRVSSTPTFFQSLNRIPSLVELHLSYCFLSTLPSLFFNSTSLRVLDLSSNYIRSSIPLWLFELRNLEYLDLNYNRFRELIPDAIGNLTSLKVLRLSSYFPPSQEEIRIPTTLRNLCMLNELDLSEYAYPHNFHELREYFSGCINESLKSLCWGSSKIKGHLPEWLGMLKNLRVIDLYDNELNGVVPESLGQLRELVRLDLSNNNLQGGLTEAHFASLTRLEVLDFSNNNLSMNVVSHCPPPPMLQYIQSESCNSGPQFPTWLRRLHNIQSIGLRKTRISGVIPNWFWNFSSVLEFIDLRDNYIKGQFPNSVEHLNLKYLYLDNNQLDGPLPLFSSRLIDLRASNNSFSGSIPPRFWKKASGLRWVFLSENNLSGRIHRSVCRLKSLEDLDLSNNHLYKGIPDCWNLSSSLRYLNLRNNNISGSIPKSICFPGLSVLYLSNNNLSGLLSLETCIYLRSLDISYNKFHGIIPVWIGNRLKNLETLRMRSNMFVGTIPDELGNLPQLIVMDLAHNNLSGVIPHSFGNLIGIKFAQIYVSRWGGVMVDFRERESEYGLVAPVTIDLGANNLDGVIPEEIATLYGLQNLNLSGNHLTGKISDKICNLRQLESLDLSFNQLSGPIPENMTALSFLDHLNLSFNNLSGRIPIGGQFQVLPDPTIYVGNHDLCGYPLNVKCHDDDNHDDGGGASQANDNGGVRNNEPGIMWFYLSMGLGFVVGFWAVCGTLLLNNKWRIAYFRFVDDLINGIHVATTIYLARMKRHCFG